MLSNNRKDYAIGVFDSGLGGLTVVKELMRQLPNENIVYFGDTARVPYGTKSKESIVRFSKENVSFLLKYKVKMIVVACNTSSSTALGILKKSFSLPIIGVIAPGARRAAQVTHNKRVGIIATLATVNSHAYTKGIQEVDHSIKVISKACPLFVPLVEEGWFHKKITMDIAKDYLRVLKRSKVDTLILGCTHYPLLKSALRKIMGQRVRLIDSAKEVASEVKQLLKRLRMERREKRTPKRTFLVSDQPQQFLRIARRFLGYDIKNIKKV